MRVRLSKPVPQGLLFSSRTGVAPKSVVICGITVPRTEWESSVGTKSSMYYATVPLVGVDGSSKSQRVFIKVFHSPSKGTPAGEWSGSSGLDQDPYGIGSVFSWKQSDAQGVVDDLLRQWKKRVVVLQQLVRGMS